MHINRYINEVNRLYGVMTTRLKDREFIAGDYSIADMSIVGWVRLAERMGQDLARFPAAQKLVRNDPGAAGGQARLCDPRRGGVCGRYERPESARRLVRPDGAMTRP